MRLRTDKNAHHILRAAASDVIVLDPDDLRLLNDRATKEKIALELGAGKGGFITQLARQNPDVHYFAFEKYETILVKALKNHLKNPTGNVTFVLGDATWIDALFKPQSVSDIYLNFSDPWPKSRHEKRRLTTPFRLEKYRNVLRDDGLIHFKTDNRSLFYYSLVTFQSSGFEIMRWTRNLMHSGFENIETEFEKRYGQTYDIHAFTARKKA